MQKWSNNIESLLNHHSLQHGCRAGWDMMRRRRRRRRSRRRRSRRRRRRRRSSGGGGHPSLKLLVELQWRDIWESLGAWRLSCNTQWVRVCWNVLAVMPECASLMKRPRLVLNLEPKLLHIFLHGLLMVHIRFECTHTHAHTHSHTHVDNLSLSLSKFASSVKFDSSANCWFSLWQNRTRDCCHSFQRWLYACVHQCVLYSSHTNMQTCMQTQTFEKKKERKKTWKSEQEPKKKPLCLLKWSPANTFALFRLVRVCPVHL